MPLEYCSQFLSRACKTRSPDWCHCRIFICQWSLIYHVFDCSSFLSSPLLTSHERRMRKLSCRSGQMYLAGFWQWACSRWFQATRSTWDWQIDKQHSSRWVLHSLFLYLRGDFKSVEVLFKLMVFLLQTLRYISNPSDSWGPASSSGILYKDNKVMSPMNGHVAEEKEAMFNAESWRVKFHQRSTRSLRDDGFWG